jgi:hypothetical protein
MSTREQLEGISVMVIAQRLLGARSCAWQRAAMPNPFTVLGNSAVRKLLSDNDRNAARSTVAVGALGCG